MKEENNFLNLSETLKAVPGKVKEENKEWLPLWIHLTDTAGVMSHLADSWIPDQLKRAICCDFSMDEFKQLCLFLALVHDIGKMTPIMVRKMLSPEDDEMSERLMRSHIFIPDDDVFGQDRNKSPHALAGEAILLKLGCPETLAVIVGAHHGKPEPLGTRTKNQMELYPCNYFGPEGSESTSGKIWTDIWQEWFTIALKETGFDTVDALPDPGISAQMLLTGLLIMADWIASNTDYFPLIGMSENGCDISPVKRAEEGWAKINLPRFWAPEQFLVEDEDFYSRFGFYPNAVQKEVISVAEKGISPGLMILETPMGSGKTEAALAAAEIIATKKNSGGLFWGMPTQATANGIFPRLKSWAEGQSEETVHAIRLAHGMAELNEDYRALFHGNANVDEDCPEDGLITHEWFQGRKQALLSEFVIGTVDQLLLAALKQKHVMLRHLGLGGKVVILDEVHSFDAYMNQYLERALNWMGSYGTPVIMLSATLPVKTRTKMLEAYMGTSISDEERQSLESRSYPVLTWTDGGKVHQKELPSDQTSISVKIESGTDSEVCAILKNILSDGGCAGIIVNTIGRAQKFAEELRLSLPDKEILLIHSGFIAADRSEKEAEILKRLGKDSTERSRDGLIVVGTQILEQSLDIDFDFLITDLCPMDLLLQRIGRLHRHSRKRPEKLQDPVCVVLGMQGELEKGSVAVYGSWLLLRTRSLLPETVSLPGMISELVQNTYEDATPEILADEELEKSWNDYQLSIRTKENKARTYRLRKPEKRSKKSTFVLKRDTIRGLLDTDLKDFGRSDEIREANAVAAVRDTDPSVEVLIMVRHSTGEVSFVPWQESGSYVAAGRTPSETESLKIARQRLKLPRALCYTSVINKTIDELEEMDRRYLPEWQKASMLRGELVLLLDDNFKAQINGFDLTYSRENGISCEKTEKGDGENDC